MRLRETRDRAAELAGAVAVNHPHGFQLAQQRFVEKFLRPRHGFLDMEPITFSSVSEPSRGCRSTFTRTRAGCA